MTSLIEGFKKGIFSAEDCDIRNRGLYMAEGTGEHLYQYGYTDEEVRVWVKGFWWGLDSYWKRKWMGKEESNSSYENISSYDERKFSCEDESIFYDDDI